MKRPETDNYLSPSELLHKHPNLARIWTPQDIGYLLMLKLVRGSKMPRTCLVSERDVLQLYRFSFVEN